VADDGIMRRRIGLSIESLARFGGPDCDRQIGLVAELNASAA
jgi:hypothetical protein